MLVRVCYSMKSQHSNMFSITVKTINLLSVDLDLSIRLYGVKWKASNLFKPGLIYLSRLSNFIHSSFLPLLITLFIQE